MNSELRQVKKLYNEKDKMHNFSHIKRIQKTGRKLERDYKKLDKELLKFLFLYHGLKDYVKQNKYKFDKDYISALLKRNPKTPEEKIVHDANLLDNVGKQGIKKALYIGKLKGRTKEETYKYLKEQLPKIKFYTETGKQIGTKKIKEMEIKLK